MKIRDYTNHRDGGIILEQEKNRCLIIYNPISGKGINKKVLDEYKKILHENGYSVDIVKTKYSSHATDTIKNADYYDVVFSIGGDGTLNEVVKGNYLRDGEKLTICPLPSGTCNDVASMFGYGNNPIENLNMALNGEVHNIDIGTINDSPFAYVVGMGQFMNIPYETTSEEKRKSGYLAYLKEGLISIANKMRRYKAEVEVDGVKLDDEYSLIMVSNANHIAGVDGFHKDVCLDDGKMEVLLCKSKNKFEFISDFLGYFTGQKSKNIISVKASDVKVKLKDKLEKKWCVDGEKYDYNGEEYHISVGNKMKFLTPSEKVKTKKLFSYE